MDVDSGLKARQKRILEVRKQESQTGRVSSKNFREIKQFDEKIQNLVRLT